MSDDMIAPSLWPVASFNLPAGAPDMEELRAFRDQQRIKRKCNDVRHKLVSRVRRSRRFPLKIRPNHTSL